MDCGDPTIVLGLDGIDYWALKNSRGLGPPCKALPTEELLIAPTGPRYKGTFIWAGLLIYGE